MDCVQVKSEADMNAVLAQATTDGNTVRHAALEATQWQI